MHDLCLNCSYYPDFNDHGVIYTVEPHIPGKGKHISKTMEVCPILQLRNGLATNHAVTCPNGLTIVAKNGESEGDGIHANPSPISK